LPTLIKNKIINPLFQINQRLYAGSKPIGDFFYGHDRWRMNKPEDYYDYTIRIDKTIIEIPLNKSIFQIVEKIFLKNGFYCLSWEGTALGRINNDEYKNSPIIKCINVHDLKVEFTSGSLTKVQLEKGEEQTSFEKRPIIPDELLLCHRYYQSQFIVEALLDKNR